MPNANATKAALGESLKKLVLTPANAAVHVQDKVLIFQNGIKNLPHPFLPRLISLFVLQSLPRRRQRKFRNF